MTPDPGDEIRDRFRAARLPPAPVRLRERIAVVATPQGATRTEHLAPRLVLAVAAILAVASVGLIAGGALDDPSPTPSALTAQASAEVTAEPTPDVTAEPHPFAVVCDEAEAPALTCAEMVQMVLEILPTNFESIAAIEVTRRCDAPCLPEATTVWFVITTASGWVVDGSVAPNGSWQMMSSETHVPDPGGPTPDPD